MDFVTYCVRYSRVEVGADDAVLLDLAEETLGVQVGEGGRHCVGGGCFVFWWMCLVEKLSCGNDSVGGKRN